MNPTSQFFWAQALQSALNGINSSNLIGTLSGVGYAILLLSFLWGVYESFLQGGDVRGFAVALMKYGIMTLVIKNWSQIFQDSVNGFGSIASTIIQNSINQDLTTSWTQQLQSYYAGQSSTTTGLTNGMEALWNIGGSLGTAVINLLLTLVAVAIWPLCVEIFALVYSLWGSVLYCIGPLVLALMPSMGFSRITKAYIQNVFIWNMWVVLMAIFWAMLWAMNLTSIDTLLNTDGLLGYLQGINATLLVSISTLLLSICTLLIPFVARHILHGEFGVVGAAAIPLIRRAATVAKALISGGAGAVAAAGGGGASSLGGMVSGSYGGGLVPSGYGGFSGGIFSSDGASLAGSSGSSRLSLPPTETPPPDSGTRHFPRGAAGPTHCRLRALHERMSRTMRRSEDTLSQEQFTVGRYYVRDGVLRAYANRFALLAFVFGGIALLSLGFAVYVRLQPPTIIRISPDGSANVISGRPLFHKPRSPALSGTDTSPEPMDYEKERIVEDFLDDYLNYDFKDVGDRWAAALNLTTDTLQSSAYNVIKKENRVGMVEQDKVRSTFEIRQIEQSKQDALSYSVYGIRNVYRMDGTREFGQQMVNRYEIRLALLDRSARTPRGLLIADYRETQLEGEQKAPSFAVDTGGIAPDDAGSDLPGGPPQ